MEGSVLAWLCYGNAAHLIRSVTWILMCYDIRVCNVLYSIVKQRSYVTARGTMLLS